MKRIFTKNLAICLLSLLSISSFANSFYWVGGSGYWNDANHWSSVSGGNGGYGLPGNHDDVYFDDNSFTSSSNQVILQTNVTIRNFNYTHSQFNPTISSLQPITFTLKGSWKASGNFRNHILGTIKFDSNGSTTLQTGGTHFRANLHKLGSGKLELLNSALDLEPGNEIILEKGKFYSNGLSVVCDRFNFPGNSNKELNLDNSSVATIDPVIYNQPNLNSSHINTEELLLNPAIFGGNPTTRGVSTCGTAPNQFTITTSVTTNYNGEDISCNGACDATVCVTITGHPGPYAVQWLGGGPATNCWSNLCPGTYTVRVTNQTTGVLCASSITVTEPGAVTVLDWAQTDPSCNGTCDGTATPLLIFGGVPPYTTTWGTGETTLTATQLCVGLNTLHVEDANNCPFDTTFFILTPTPMMANINLTMVSCFGVCDGVAVSNPSGGNGAPFTWSWSGGSTTNTQNGLCAGTHTLHIEDANNCPKDTTFTITEPIAISITLTGQTNLLCNNICTGSLTVSSANGTAPHSYQWYNATTGLPLAGQTSATASNLCAGDYYVIVTDAQGCFQQSATFTLTQPPAITFSTSGTQPSCNGVCDGTLSVTSGGGTPTHSYNWINAATGNSIGTGANISNVCPGNYFVVITDGNGCVINSTPPVQIIDPPALQLVIDTVRTVCYGDCNGSASVNTVSGGTGALTVSWINSVPTTIGTGNNISGLCAGNYTGRVTDANGCVLNVPFVIAEPADWSYTLNTTTVSCVGSCNATADLINISGQTPNYSFTWSSSANTTSTETGLCIGNYTVTITDVNGCDTIIPFSIVNPVPLTINPSTTDPSCTGMCDGSAIANDAGGTAPYNYQWFDVTNSVMLPTNNDTITGLCPGNYTLTVTDALGCTVNGSFTINNPPGMTATISVSQSSCGNCTGTATATIVGGTSPYTVSWINIISGPTGVTGNPGTGLCAGDYYGQIVDANGCTAFTDSATITDNTVITGSVVPTDATCFGFCNGSIDLTVSGGTPPMSFQWFDQATGLPIGQSAEDAIGLCDGTYYVVATDSNFCNSPPFSATINEPTQLTGSASGVDATCLGSCNGQGTITVNGGTGPYTFNWVDQSNGATVSTNQNPNNLCAGSYDVTITDANNCSIGPFTVTINAPAALTAAVSTNNSLCLGACNGSATLNVTGGTAPYTATWSSSGNTSLNENGLCAGNYTVSLVDANGCSFGPLSFTITAPPAFNASTAGGTLLCFGSCNGSVSVTATGGTPPYSYQWGPTTGNQTTPVASGLCAGTYGVTVTDANGCVISGLTATLTQPTQLTANTSSTPASCNGVCDGTASVVAAGGTAPYTYSWNDPFNQNTATAINLCAGNVSVTVTDANGCTVTPAAENVSQPNVLNVSASSVDPTCFAGCNGTATVNIAGGTAPFTILWNDPANQSTVTATGLCSGNYSVNVTDVGGCTGNANVTLNDPAEITATTSSVNSTCNLCDGSVTVNPVGGTGALSILWDDAGSSTTSTVSNLCAGIYNATVTDALGCSVVFTVPLSDANGEVLTMDSTAASCFGACNGSVTVSFACGVPNCSILWNDPGASTTNTVNGLCAGTYGVTVTNGGGCISSTTVSVPQPTTIIANPSATNELCAGACNGTGSVAPSGGTAPYSFLWNAAANNQIASTAFNLCAGNYSVVITDANGCTANASVTINSPTPLSASVSGNNITCNGLCNGTATAFPSGGTGPYTYQWDDPASQTTQQATGLCAGTYNVTVFDASGCTFGPLQITLTEPDAISATVSGSGLACFGNCNATLTVTPNGGTTPFTYQWNDPLNQTTQTATNLCGGSYDVTLTDLNGCQLVLPANGVFEPAQLNASTNVTGNACNANCNGSIAATVTGGTVPYSYSWNDPANQTSSTASNLCAGNYTLTVTDANGCLINVTDSVTQPNPIQITLTRTNPSCNASCNGTITSAISGGTAPFSYSWSNGSNSANLSSLCAGTYTLNLTDANGCTSSASIVLVDPNAIILNTSSGNATCGVCNGTAFVSPAGGYQPFSILWGASAGNQTTQTASGLCAGIYTVTVTDAIGCSLTTSVAVSDNNGEAVSVSSTDATCFGACNGSITANSPCVNAPCTYAWFNQATGAPIGQTTPTATNLCQGIYYVMVTNASNCVTVRVDTINQPTEIFANEIMTNVDCGGNCNGTISLTPSGGTGPYTYQWNAAAGNATTASVNGLCAGTYIVDITDALNCTKTDTFTITEPLALSVVLTDNNALCNGACDGNSVSAVNGGTAPFTYLWSNGQTTATAVNLCAGNYSLTVTDANGCTANANSVITEPTGVNVSTSFTDATCFGTCDGTATATPSGGTSPYSYQWNDPASQTTATATGLCAGNYTVIVGDANGCPFGPLPVTISAPNEVTFTVTTTSISCNGTCNGSITINAAGGDGNYLYSINNGVNFQASNVFNNLCAGSYTVVVVDGNTCSSSTQNININQPTPITTTSSAFPSDCIINNGAASVFPIGGTPGYTYQWLDVSMNPIGQITQTAINLGAGIYNVIVTDAAGCSITVNVIVPNVNAPILSGVTTNVSCIGSCTGSIDLTISGGTPGYTTLWLPTGQTSEDINNLCAGGYIVQVTDIASCSAFMNFTISEPTALNASFVSTDATCGACDGTITVTPSGGTGSTYTFDWSNGQTTATATGLCSGAYMVLITDSLGCSQTFNTSINNIGGPTSEVVNQTNASCFGTCDGAVVSVTPIGGTAPYSFYWVHNGSTTVAQNNLCAGTYFLEIIDSNGCIRVTNINITSPQPITDSTILTPTDCGACNGAINVFVNGSNGPFTYQWDAAAGSATTQNVSNLCSGVYSMIVTDAIGCRDTIVNIVNGSNAAQLLVTTTDVSCQANCDGTADVSTNLGTPPFSITWLNGFGTPIGQTGTPASALCAGDYIAQVDDVAGCTSFSQFSIDEPDSMQFSLPFVIDPSCFNTCDGVATAIVIEGVLPYTFVWNDPGSQTTATASGLCGGNFIVTVTDGNGCSQTQNITLTPPAAITLQLDSTDASCNTVADGAVDATPAGGAGGFTFSWTGPSGFTANTEDINNIFPGTYVLTVTDANGCSLTDSIVVGSIITVIPDAGLDTAYCFSTNPITLTGSGGNTYEWFDMAGNSLGSNVTLTTTPGMGTTSYVLVANINGCLNSDTVDVTLNALPTVNAGGNFEIIQGASVTIGGFPTTAPTNTVVWTPNIYLNSNTLFNPIATPDSSTCYTVTATDPNGCSQSDTMCILVLPNITFPNGFSPNGDGLNDVWVIDWAYLFPDIQVEVYNRWGQLLFLSVGYNTPWDGTYNNQDVPIGTYYYIINLNHPLYPDAFTGPLTVIR